MRLIIVLLILIEFQNFGFAQKNKFLPPKGSYFVYNSSDNLKHQTGTLKITKQDTTFICETDSTKLIFSIHESMDIPIYSKRGKKISIIHIRSDSLLLMLFKKGLLTGDDFYKVNNRTEMKIDDKGDTTVNHYSNDVRNMKIVEIKPALIPRIDKNKLIRKFQEFTISVLISNKSVPYDYRDYSLYLRSIKNLNINNLIEYLNSIDLIQLYFGGYRL